MQNTSVECSPRPLLNVDSGERRVALRDLIELGKPRITVFVLFTAAVGLWMSPGALRLTTMLAFLAGTALLVASANTLNSWLEKDSDGLMRRTRNRALPAGRLEPRVALTYGLVTGTIALGILALTTNRLTTGLGLLALTSYVLVYTPMKKISPWALVVGALPGAIPPLMGWTAETGSIGAPAWVLFGILFVWQLPHFTAISMYLKEDYRRGGILVLPVSRGDAAARRCLFATTILLVLVSLTALPLGVAGPIYLVAAAILGAGFLALAWRGAQAVAGSAGARRAFAYSLIYLPLIIGILMLDAR